MMSSSIGDVFRSLQNLTIFKQCNAGRQTFGYLQFEFWDRRDFAFLWPFSVTPYLLASNPKAAAHRALAAGPPAAIAH